ncbi:MAG: sulfite exporter TauE/SafE family protein [Proteobacteria bacterium]|nr:sulfite exporter TauE/SafE family protein [Pseudomonadota bacterium]
MLIWLAFYLVLGLGVGFFAGLLGIGGGAIMVPILTSLFIAQGFSAEHVVHMALATSLSAMIVTAFSSIKTHHAHKAILMPIVKNISPAIIIGSFLAASLATQISAHSLAVFFVIFMSFIALQMLLNKKPKPSRQVPGMLTLSFAGLVIGAISAVVAIGGGALTVPFLSWCNINIKNAIATSAAIGMPIAIFGSMAYIVNSWQITSLPEYSVGYVYIPAMISISVSSYFTAPIGAKLTHRLPVAILKKVFALLVVLLAVKMLATQV